LEPGERKRNDSQGSDDGSSSEGDPTPLSSTDAARTEYYLIVTDPTAAVPQQSETSTELDGVSIRESRLQ
jgi:hypothetical protein